MENFCRCYLSLYLVDEQYLKKIVFLRCIEMNRVENLLLFQARWQGRRKVIQVGLEIASFSMEVKRNYVGRKKFTG